MELRLYRHRVDIDRARSLIRELSELPARSVELLGTGTDSAAFRVDCAWVVRFPLVPEARRALRIELALLPELAEKLPVAVPCPEHIGEHNGQLVFGAYRALEGVPLSDAALRALSPTARARALDELASALDAIRRFPLECARAAEVGFELCKGGYHAAQEHLERGLDGMLSAVDLAAIAGQRHVFERAQSGRVTPVLLHADIKPAHVLHCPRSGEVTGLLDWGDVSLGHRDFDLAIVGAFCGPQTLRGLLERLDRADARRARASIPFLLTVRWLQDALYIISRGGDEERVDRCLRRLREHLRTSSV